MAAHSPTQALEGAIRAFTRVTDDRDRREESDALRVAVRAVVSRWNRDAVRDALLPYVARLHRCPMVEGQTRSLGKLVLKRDAPEYEAARKALWRLLDELFPKEVAPPPRTEPKISAKISQDVASLIKRYESDSTTRRLLKKCLQEALDKM
jgi:hypothetical protein